MASEQRCIQENAGRTQRERTPQPPSLAEEQRRPHRRSQETPGDAGSARWPGTGPRPSQHKPPTNNWAREDSTPVKEQARSLHKHAAKIKGEK